MIVAQTLTDQDTDDPSHPRSGRCSIKLTTRLAG